MHHVGFLVAHAAARLLAQIFPDLRDVATERLAADDFRGARAWQIDVDNALHLAGAVGHYQDAVGHLHRFGDVVGDQQRGLLELLLDLQHFVAEQEPCLLVERGERLVHQQDFRLGGEGAGERDALAHAAGELAGIAVLEAVEPDHSDEMTRALGAFGARHADEFEREGDVVDHRAPGESRILPGTPCRSICADRKWFRRRR